MKTSLKLAAVALSAFGIVGGATLAQAEGKTYVPDPSVTPRAASPMSGFSTNGTPRGNEVESLEAVHNRNAPMMYSTESTTTTTTTTDAPSASPSTDDSASVAPSTDASPAPMDNGSPALQPRADRN